MSSGAAYGCVIKRMLPCPFFRQFLLSIITIPRKTPSQLRKHHFLQRNITLNQIIYRKLHWTHQRPPQDGLLRGQRPWWMCIHCLNQAADFRGNRRRHRLGPWWVLKKSIRISVTKKCDVQKWRKGTAQTVRWYSTSKTPRHSVSLVWDDHVEVWAALGQYVLRYTSLTRVPGCLYGLSYFTVKKATDFFVCLIFLTYVDWLFFDAVTIMRIADFVF